MKFFILSILVVFSLTASASNVQFTSYNIEQKSESLDELYPGIKNDLLMVQSHLDRRSLGSAQVLLNNIISRLDDGRGGVRNFTSLGLVYNTTNTRFICNSAQIQQARQVGSNAALNSCYRAGMNRCHIISSQLLTNGYLGTINGVYYGHGCKVSVIVRGQ